MKKTRFNEKQVIAVLKEQKAGMKVVDLCRKHGVSEQTFHNWKKKYGGFTVSELRRMRELEQENSRLKRLVADQASPEFPLMVVFLCKTKQPSWAEIIGFTLICF